MSDVQPGPEAPPPAAPETPTAPPPQAPPPAADPFDSPDTATFDRAYVERIRNEAAGYRTKARELEERYKPWDEATTGFEEEERQAARELLVAIREGDVGTVDAILGRTTPGQAAPAATNEAGGPLTAADVARMLDEREAKAAQAAQVRAVEDEARRLGYQPEAARGTDEWLNYSQLVALAHARTGGDLNAAHAALEAQRQAYIDSFLAGKENAGTTPAPPTNGMAPSGERDMANWTLEDARRAAAARLGARQTG